MADRSFTKLVADSKRLLMIEDYEHRIIARYSWSGVLSAQERSHMPMSQWREFVHWVHTFRPWMLNDGAET